MSEDSKLEFASLGLAEPILRAVAEKGYTKMSPIQAQAIPVVLSGRDVMGAAQTGTGKTAAFTLPLLQRMMPHASASMSPARHPVRALVLAPTRELADQVAQNVQDYAKYTQLRSAVVFGGMDIKPQIAELKKGVEVLVATPGRLLDHIEAKSCNLNHVEYVVLDEADRMLDIGFLPDLQRILSYLPKKRITLLFSATFSPEIKRLSASYLQDPVLVEVATPNETAKAITQKFYAVDGDKRTALVQLAKEHGITQAFVFTNSKMGCGRLARELEREGLRTTALHGDKTQDERLKALEAFKSGEVDLLVATDVAARGLDIKDVPAVFNFDLPFHAEDYVHRIGRTGRAGATGLAISLVGPSDSRFLQEIEKITKTSIKPEVFRPQAAQRSGGGHELRGGAYGGGASYSSGRSAAGASSGGERSEAPRYRARQEEEPKPIRGSAFRPKYMPRDPFFDQPYEPAASSDASPAAWEKASSPVVNSRLSPNIKNKRKLAALFKTS